ncbi:MAG TPA: double-strand break repair helicase AddA [Rhodobacteraceae bacterium]|nr:double-strand break repair helicase AddA [Paracoccaceae bacterium]
MSEARKAEATEAQIAAAWPARSAWVSANAGSGKTRVLTNRVARLLLNGTPPGRILCLTFTKAAAAEMQNRLFKQLGEWAMMPNAPLRAALAALGESDLPEAQLLHARSLFARALETPGGLKIQTIHAFCESLLHRFPLEAQVSPDFDLLDERGAKALRAEVLDEMALETPEDFAAFIEKAGEPEGFLHDILKHQELFEHAFYEDAAAEALGAEPELTEEMMLARVLKGFDDQTLDAFINALIQGGGVKDGNAAEQLAASRKNPAKAALDLLTRGFLRKDKLPLSTRGFPVAAAKKLFPTAQELMQTLIERVYAAHQSRLAMAALEKARVLHVFATGFLARYNTHKSTRAVLEFEDLIRKADALLRDSDMAQWVLYRLDGGIDHILVDEAQDTSPLQWDIVKALAEEIYAAEGDTPRTVFVVGDEKQSIFSFQGADPHEFARVKSLLHERLEAVETPMFEGELQYSFRSAPPILNLVDQVFSGEARGGVVGDIRHGAVDEALPGRVELWPFYEKMPAEEALPWDAPVDALPPSDPMLLLAEDVAARVAEIIAGKVVLPGKNRPVQAGDFLILVQARGDLFKALLKELKAAGVPVAGADRLKVAEELAVKDLLALLQFAANPQDDLALACALRSPLCGVSEAALFKLAHGRKGRLWDMVRPDDMLSDILDHVDYSRPFELLQRILIHHKGREKLLARLGPEAEEGVDELLRQALEYERGEAPSLTGFLNWVKADELDVKRQFNNEDNLLRIMTVHGAKGLEAPIVILPQTVKKANNQGKAVLALESGLAACGAGVAELPEALAEVRQAQQDLQTEEKMRLLYVALTRAKSWLIMAGSGDRKRVPENWYDPVAEALSALGAETRENGRIVLENNWQLETGEALEAAQTKVALPDWLSQPAPQVIKPPRPKSPSDLGGEHTIAGAIPEADALLRGSQIHILLEHLGGVPEGSRKAAALKLVETPLSGVIDEALAALKAPALAAIFAPETLREVAVSALLPDIGPISGRIDALLIGDTILAVDFKSNPQVPAEPEGIPEGFLRQMAAYGAALAQVYPDREIKTAILWTATQSLMEVPARLRDAALKRAAGA